MENTFHRVVRWLSVLLLLGASSTNSAKSSESDYKLVCYYANWAIYRPGLAKFTPENIDPYLCTHLIYAFAGMNKNYELKPFDSYNDVQLGNYKKFTNLKTYNPKLKMMIAVGGWNEGSKRFSNLVESPSNRLKFVRGAMSFLRKHGFDGLDLDWEYPASRDGGREGDKEGYTKLVKELREAFDSENIPRGKTRLLLSMAVPAGKPYIDKGYDIPLLSRHLDFLNMLTYDYHTSQEVQAHHHAPLREEPGLEDWHPNKQLNIEWTIKYYVKLGADPGKMILGIPTYGRSFTLADPEETEMGAPCEGPGEKGNATREAGYLAYYEICQMIQDDEWELEAPYPELMGPYAYKDNQWVGFDDEEIIIEKVKFIIREGLGGGMVWTLDNDDFRGKCYGEQSPLISTLKSSLKEGRAILSHETTTTTVAPRTTKTANRRQQISKTTRKPAKTSPPFTTPDPGPPFECEDEGFFNNPTDCKKYFWCLDSGPSNLGLVAHSFTCPSGLYFNKARDSCDYASNVVCRVKKTTTVRTTTKPKRRPRPRKPSTTTPKPKMPKEVLNSLDELKLPGDSINMNSQSLVELLQLIQQLGVNQIHDKLHGRESNEATSTINPTLLQYRQPNRRKHETSTIEPTTKTDLFFQYAKPDRTIKREENSEILVKPRGPQYHIPASEAEEMMNEDIDYGTTSSDEKNRDTFDFPFVYQTPSRHITPDEEEEDDVTTMSLKPTKPTRSNRKILVRVRPIPRESKSTNQHDEKAKPETRRNYIRAQTVGVRREVVRPQSLEEIATTFKPPYIRRARPATRKTTSTPPRRYRGPPPTKELIVLATGKPAVPATTRQYRPVLPETRGPALALLPDGGITCLRRGVHPHPKDCAKFLVCVPSDSTDELDGFIHDCPPNTYFMTEKTRCMPGDIKDCSFQTN